MFKYVCECGISNILLEYRIHLEGTITFRDYSGKCRRCNKTIETRDLDENDLDEQEFSC